jgi:hypothetical protein
MFRLPKQQVAAGLRVLDPRSVEEIPAVRDDPELAAAAGKLQGFKTRLQAIKIEQSKGFLDSSGPAKRFDQGVDAAVLMAGGQLDSQVSAESIGRRLAREFAALETAIGQQTELVRQINCRAIMRLCEANRDVIFPFLQNVVAAFEQLEMSLRQMGIVDACLSGKSYQSAYRPAGWSILPYELVLLHGGRGISSLPWWIDLRKKTLGLSDGAGKNKGE